MAFYFLPQKVKRFWFILWLFFSMVKIAGAQMNYNPFVSANAAAYKEYNLLKPVYAGFENYHQPAIHLFPDSVKKWKKKSCCNSWCFGTSFVPLLNLVSYNSFLLNEKVKFKGIKLGAEIGQRVRFGIGGYKLADPIELSPLISDVDTVSRQLRFEYYNLFWEFVFYEDFRWEIAMPLSIGKAFGKIDTFSVRNNNVRGQMNADSTGLATIGFDFEYRFIPWLGVGGGVGYRQAFAPREIREKLNAPFYAVKVKIFLGYLFKAVFMKDKLSEEREAYMREKEERKKRRKEKREKKDPGEEADNVEGINDPLNKNDY